MAIRPDILSWLRRGRERAARVEADVTMLVSELGEDAYSEARLMERRGKSANERRHWREVSQALARKTGKRIGLDTATRMALGADFEGRGNSEPVRPEPKKVDPIDELKRLIGGEG
jgi:hypothetical protein